MTSDPNPHAADPVVPMKVNAFHAMRNSNSQLMPLFPYLHQGAMVPCTSGFEGDAGSTIGYFLHENSVDEVGLVLGSEGRMRTGDIFRGPREHGVGFTATAPFFSVSVITQRQQERGEQPEAMSIKCESCSHLLVRHEFSGVHIDQDGLSAAISPLPTNVGSLTTVERLQTPGAMTCPACGHENAPFPLDIWGWNRYVKNTRIAAKAIRAHREATK